jgi:hypothetical protein
MTTSATLPFRIRKASDTDDDGRGSDEKIELNKRAASLGPKNDMDVPVSLGNKNGLELAILPRAEKTLEKIIAKPDSPELIDGVKIEPLQVYPDDRGFFMELARLGKGLATQMVPEGQRQIQVSFTLTYPGTIKAIQPRRADRSLGTCFRNGAGFPVRPAPEFTNIW